MRKVVSVLLVVIWMLTIFDFSNATGEKSGGLSDKIIKIGVTIFTDIEDGTEKMDEIVSYLSFPVRKCAHFFVYFVLGFLVMNALYINGVTKKTLIICGVISILYASLDEFHQTFINGRSGQISDVLLDSSGALFSSFLFHKFIIMRGNYEKKNN